MERKLQMSKINQFSKTELNRYSRHFNIPEFGVASQLELKNSSVLVIGAGGLGSPVLLYLAAAGVGHIGIVEFDVVDESNLQRQVLYTTKDIGQPKAQIAKQRLEALNPYIKITLHESKITSKNALEIISQYDVVADGTDNFPTRYLVNDACVLAGKVNVFASIYRFEGQVAVFNFLNNDGSRTSNYRDLFPSPPPPDMIPSCAEGGVLGILPGIIGSMQATEVIKVITEIGEPLINRFFMYDAASFTMRTLKVQKNPTVQISTLIDYEAFCGIREKNEHIKEITTESLKKMITQNVDFQLIDVREPHEYAVENLNGTLIPLGDILERSEEISKNKKVIIHCKSGARSIRAIEQLQKIGFDNLYNLKGGMEN